MKRTIIISLITFLFSIAALNTLVQKNVNDACLNQIGITAMVNGAQHENSVVSHIGGTVTAIGGGVTGTGVLGILGFVTLSNPVGWILGGIVIGA